MTNAIVSRFDYSSFYANSIFNFIICNFSFVYSVCCILNCVFVMLVYRFVVVLYNLYSVNIVVIFIVSNFRAYACMSISICIVLFVIVNRMYEMEIIVNGFRNVFFVLCVVCLLFIVCVCVVDVVFGWLFVIVCEMFLCG